MKVKVKKDKVDSGTPETQENQNTDLSLILQRLDEQDALIREQADKIKELSIDTDENLKNQRYSWPRKYSFKVFDGMPVLSYKSFKKDTTRDWKYKTIQWQEIINHYLKLLCWDFEWDKEVEREISFDIFNEWFNYSEKMFCEVISNWTDVEWYKFKTKDFWIFTVKPNSIN